MPDDPLRYDVMVEEALRAVVRKALDTAAESGLPGKHHFYVTFRTDHPKVKIPDVLRERFPSEMTIVLQYQFWALKVSDEKFQVTLSFDDKPERLTVPFEAISAFADPSVRFGLQFNCLEAGEGEELEDGALAVTDLSFDKGDGEAPNVLPGQGNSDNKPKKTARKARGTAAKESAEEESGKVVTLDAFRKK